MIKRGLIFIVILFLGGCFNTEFRKYPPGRYLNDEEQLILLRKFIPSLYDTTKGDQIPSAELIEDFLTVYEFKGYLQKDGKNYFIISSDVNVFTDAASGYLGGVVSFSEKDTLFDLKFNVGTSNVNKDSVEVLFESLIEGKTLPEELIKPAYYN